MADVEVADKGSNVDTALERDALTWMEDPFEYFGNSVTRMHSIPREEAERIQLAAMNIRLEQRREQIPVLAKLADAQGIRTLDKIDDIAPVLFTHDIYKSYPVSLLAKQRFDQLNKWLDRLTQYDLSGVDVSDCKSIDEWLQRLKDETPLDTATSSGTSGTMSFLPKTKRDYRTSVRGKRVQLVQTFGEEPTEEDANEKIHVVTPMYRYGHNTQGGFTQYLMEEFCRGDESFLHVAFPFKLSCDLMYLAGRLRAAEAKGDSSKVDVPDALLARREEWAEIQRDAPAQRARFIRALVDELRGQRIFALGMTPMFYEIAKKGLEDGVHGSFAPNSVILGGGGAKGMVLPDNVDEIILEFFGAKRMSGSYGMTELNGFSFLCEQGHYHLLPWVSLFVLDLDTGQPLPRKGTQTGRAAYFDPTHDGTWGGIVTGDMVTADWDGCACGRSTVALHKKIQRVSEAQGGDDKITCAAVPAAQNDAMEFLTSL